MIQYETSYFIFQQYLRHKEERYYIPFEQRTVKNIRLVKIFFWSRGRNAWYGTWIRNFYPGESLYSSLDEAKNYSENRRKQGNVFYIDELPALIFELERNIGILLFQINTDKPFQKMNFDCIQQRIDSKQEITYIDIYQIFNNYYLRSDWGCVFNESCWKEAPSRENSFIFLYLYSTKSFISLRKEPLKSFYSSSVGANYYLNWNINKNYKISLTYIKNIYEILC